MPVTALLLGPDDGDARLAEWYEQDGATVRRGQPIYRLETDFAAVEVEAEADGVLRHRAKAGEVVLAEQPIAFITAPDEAGPARKTAPKTAPGEAAPAQKSRPRAEPEPALPSIADVLPESTDPPPPLTSPRARARARANAARNAGDGGKAAKAPPGSPASVLRAAIEEVSARAGDVIEESPWQPDPEPEAGAVEHTGRTPTLLFPRIVSELREQSLATTEDDEDGAFESADGAAAPMPAFPSAWDLVPGENDFNPDWLMEREGTEEEQPEKGRSRFQASSIRRLALGRKESPAESAETPWDHDGENAEASPTPERPHTKPSAAKASNAVAPAPIAPELTKDERRGLYHAGTSLHVRVTVDMGEAIKMRDQLTREWWGSNVRPSDEDIVLRALARALGESAAFRRHTDVVGIRALATDSRGVYPLSDAATRPFREAVAAMATLRKAPGSQTACICTLTSFAEMDLDEGVPGLAEGQRLAVAMGAVRDTARFRGDQPYRAALMTLTLAYDLETVPEGAAARLLSRIRELVEAPYALLAH